MNIFVLSLNHKQCAAWHCDKHITKMPLEAAQLLCTAINLAGGTSPYKTAHKNHPCAIWTRQTRSNFLWLAELGYELCAEYTKRYGKIHKCESVIDTCVLEANLIKEGPLTPFAQAMPDEYKASHPVTAYQAYYIGAKTTIAKWNHSPPPTWWPILQMSQTDTQNKEGPMPTLEKMLIKMIKEIDTALTVVQIKDTDLWTPMIEHPLLNGWLKQLFRPYAFNAGDPNWNSKINPNGELTDEFKKALTRAKETIIEFNNIKERTKRENYR